MAAIVLPFLRHAMDLNGPFVAGNRPFTDLPRASLVGRSGGFKGRWQSFGNDSRVAHNAQVNALFLQHTLHCGIVVEQRFRSLACRFGVFYGNTTIIPSHRRATRPHHRLSTRVDRAHGKAPRTGAIRLAGPQGVLRACAARRQMQEGLDGCRVWAHRPDLGGNADALGGVSRLLGRLQKRFV